MKAPPGMRVNRIVLHILLVVLSLDHCQVYGFSSLPGDVIENCTVELLVTRGYRYPGKPGDFLSIECPVKYCTGKPAMNWCKIQDMYCLLLKDGPTRQTAWKEGNVFVLNFVPVHKNDSGLYRCQATVGSLSSESHSVEVLVQEVTTNAPTNPQSMKPKTTPVTSQKEMNMISRSTCAPYHTDRTTHAPSEGSTLYYCSMASLQQPLDDSTIYDNHVPHWNGSRAATGNASDSAAVDSYQPSSESEDVLVYASLNHSSIIEKLPRKEQNVEIELTEYATVCVKK
ncbi:B- and T-lymphocyte attenuator isoform X3 [Dermochelys coriacea]|uniref:B- and T-lymphocyte attenuator isoform X3 n=1 Tax=Dermochelys coriacea TaxID=27794 RepID=UPI001CA9F8AD|nr:B- and T-lymphocyte attenuator isoform X3 [Dermochelys coriacea]